jgi:KUP system potassium uptake protein
MEHGNNHQHIDKVTFAGLLIALGIVFGDIGTSPLYVFSAIVGTRKIEPMLVLGGLSAVFWTLMFQTTIKYVLIALRADNNGEGGIFSLYALIKRYAGSWLLYPAIVGGSFLLADGIITPPISVSSAIEGLRIYSPEIPTVPIVIAIIIGLFVTQQFGTQLIGKFFGPVMTLWFGFIGVIGLLAFVQDFSVLKAISARFLAARGCFSLHDRSRSVVFGYGTRGTCEYPFQLGFCQNLSFAELRRAISMAFKSFR